MEKYYTPEEAAEFLKVKKTTIWTWLRTGKLKGVKSGKIWRIKEEDLEEILSVPSLQNNTLGSIEIALVEIEKLLDEINRDKINRETVEKVKSVLLKIKATIAMAKNE